MVLLATSVLTIASALNCVLACPVAVQEEPGTKEWRKALTTLVKEKEDAEAVNQVEALVKAWEGLEEKDQKDCLKDLSKYVKVRRPDEETALHTALVTAFGKMGPEGRKSLKKALRIDPVKDRESVLAAAVTALGSFQDKKDKDLLFDFLLHKDTPVIKAAIEVLGEFTHDDRMRKEVFDQLLQSYQGVYSRSLPAPNRDREQGQPVKRPDEKTLKALEASFEKALSNLSKESQTRGARAWQNWYTDNKRKRWVEDKEGGSP